ncbi:histidinol-phosphatase HisJ family protein [Salibacterium salarium]|uniref:Histidinol-phosphatase n=1 Tax=Salibacterium salarium TaxID=284579 RepID=A0A3R9QQ95_9BACI|nr:histidinol-phosphatase [Salibacterium salarium]RSL35211.1 histidinol-phosphatase HisJ family protein [Salibacterium salarium]
MKFDLHTHHERCGHATGEIEDYIQSAINKGLHVIGISDHSPYFGEDADHPYPGLTMAKSEFSNYVREVRRLKEIYQDKIEVLLGVESDFFPDAVKAYKQVYDNYPMDYIIGSVHFVHGINIFDKRRWDGLGEKQILDVKEEYYRLIAESAKSGMFQVLGHIDALKGYFPSISDVPTNAVDQTLKVIAESGVAIEVNTSGKNKDCGGWYPSDDILERAKFYNIPITLGSDSHVPERMGDDFDEVGTFLKSLGYREWYFFRNKKPVAVSL